MVQRAGRYPPDINLIVKHTPPAGSRPPAGGLRRIIYALFLIISCIYPHTLSGEEPTPLVQEVHSRLLAAGYSPADSKPLIAALQQAQAQNIPVELLSPRIFEGAAKQIPWQRILSVIERETEQLAAARGFLRSIPGTDPFLQRLPLWQRTAHLLEAGLGKGEIRRLVQMSVAKPDTFRPASSLFFSLTSWGLARDETLLLLEALVDSHIPPDEYAGVTRLYSLGQRQRLSPEQLTERIIRATKSVSSLKDLERLTIMQQAD